MRSRVPLYAGHTHSHTHTRSDTGPCVLFPLATEVQYLRQNKYPSPLFYPSLASSFLSSPLLLHLIIFLSPLQFYHLISISLLCLSLSLPPSLPCALSLPGPLTNTAQCLPGHTPFSMLIVPPDSFCSREKKRLLPSSLLPSPKFTSFTLLHPPHPAPSSSL